ncbi:MAG: rhodanese-like domain-containing protein [Ignavibacteria bacterium]|nr:rhodanese-like domain-containing protein [Ignavibacteria bacterium]
MKIRRSTGIAILAFAALVGVTTLLCQQDPQSIKTTSPGEVYQWIQSDSSLVLLDVRTAQEFDGELGHVAHAILLPVQELDSHMKDLDSLKAKTVVTICRSGNRSARAATMLQEHGFRVYNMSGGMLKWNAEGLPVVRGERE